MSAAVAFDPFSADFFDDPCATYRALRDCAPVYHNAATGRVVVLVDTSVWVRFLAGREPDASALDGLLAGKEVLRHDLVQGELLIGDAGRSRKRLLEAYAKIHRARTVPHVEVVEFVAARQLHGRDVGWIDVHLLASAVVERCTLWSADASLADLAAELHVAHTPSP